VLLDAKRFAPMGEDEVFYESAFYKHFVPTGRGNVSGESLAGERSRPLILWLSTTFGVEAPIMLWYLLEETL
jgi:hypothetical protein